MAHDYGYATLENKLIDLFFSGTPDFGAAEDLIQQGANINATGNDDTENILFKILSDYWYLYPDHSSYTNHANSPCEDSSTTCELESGAFLCSVIRFFLDHGFDVTKCGGCFGAQCLWALTSSTYDRFMIEATKLLFDAGARNRTISLTSANSDETPWDLIATETSYQEACEHDYSAANIYEAVYQMYQAIEDGKPYSGIDSYEVSIGKKIQKVLTVGTQNPPAFFSQNLPDSKTGTCYLQPLYFVYENGILIATQYVSFWTDTILPEKNLVDVSEHFGGIVGHTIRCFTYGYKSMEKRSTCYSLPVTTIETDSGHSIRFSLIFGVAKEAKQMAYYEILNEISE